MTERERIRGDESTGRGSTPRGAPVYSAGAPGVYDTDTGIAAPKDLVRWGPVLAGLFAALATLVTLGVLGLAIGLATYDPGDPARNFGIGAGIWGAISALLAFLVGGWLAGRTAAVRGSNSGILNGAMVWFVAVPLLLYMLGSGIGALTRAAGNVAATGAQIAAPAAGAVLGDPALQATAAAGVPNLSATAQALPGQATAGDIERAANTGSQAAWSTLLSLGLAAAAAITGGYLGARTPARRDMAVG